MIRLVALYKRPADPAAFEKYYFGTHKPLAEKIPGVVEYRCSKIFGGLEGKSPWFFLAELCFKDKETFKAAMTSPQAQAAGADVDNFAKGLAEIFFVDDAAVPAAPARDKRAGTAEAEGAAAR